MWVDKKDEQGWDGRIEHRDPRGPEDKELDELSQLSGSGVQVIY